MSIEITVQLACRLVNAANTREHWAKRAKRAKLQRWAAHVMTLAAIQEAGFIWPVNKPLTITITRIGPGNRPMDKHDGLTTACKPIVDGVADALAVDDGDARLTWTYAQKRGPYGCEVRIAVRIRGAAEKCLRYAIPRGPPT